MSIMKLQTQRYWIFGPLQDMTFVLLTPLPILLTFGAAHRGGWLDGLVAFVLALAMAHYLPGILRAYGDRALFHRFRVRLIVAPLFLITITTWFAYLNLNFVFLLVGLWGAWHWLMQVYGFARIYDAKMDSGSRTSGRLDQMICVMWFGMCVFVLNNILPMYVTKFYESGGPRLPAGAFVWFSQIWLTLTVGLTLYYAIHAVRSIRRGLSPNPLKFLLIAVTFLYLAYTASMVDRPTVGYAMFESWHDIQYLAIVWLFNLNRAKKSPEAGGFIRFLFRPRAILVLAYVGLCLLFGSLTHAWRLFEGQIAARVAASLVMAAALLHYYLDGFIWKIREKETRQALGVDAQESSPAFPELVPAWSRHALLWLLFVIPAALFFLMESRANVARPLQVYEKLAETFPNFAHAHHELGRQLQNAGRLEEAKAHFELATALAPDLLPAHVLLGALLSGQNNLAGARSHLDEALRIDPNNAQAHNNLGIVFDQQDDLAGAQFQFELAVRLDPEYALAHNNFGIVLAKRGDLALARVHHERAVRINPDFADAHYQLGLTMARQGDLAGAVDHLEQTLRIDPNQYFAHNSLGAVLVNQGKLSEAKAHFEQALRIEPGDVYARQNLAKTEAALQDRR